MCSSVKDIKRPSVNATQNTDFPPTHTLILGTEPQQLNWGQLQLEYPTQIWYYVNMYNRNYDN